MTVLFKVWTAYTIFTSAVLSELYYKNDYKIVLISDNSPLVKEFIPLLKKSKLFDEILVSNEMSYEVYDVKKRVEDIVKINIDIFHMFFFDVDSVELVYQLPNTTKIILTDEGTSTACLKRHYNRATTNQRMPLEWLKYHENRPILWNKISEVMLYDERLYDCSVDLSASRIEIQKILMDKEKYARFLNHINALFSYESASYDFDYIYFDSYSGEANFICEDYEKYFCSQLIKLLQQKKYVIKLHPNDTEHGYKYRYGCSDINMLQSSVRMPWEVVYLNLMYDNPHRSLYLISYDSMAAFNSIIMGLKVFQNVKAISLSKMFKPYILNDVINSIIEDYRDRFSMIYRDNYYVVSSIQDLQKQIHSNGEKVQYNIPAFDDHEHYMRRTKLIGNTVEESILNVIVKDNLKKMINYIDYSYEHGEIHFNLNINQGDNYEIKWNVVTSSICRKIFIHKIVLQYKEGYEVFDEELLSKDSESIVCDNDCFSMRGVAKRKYIRITFYYSLYDRYQYREILEKEKLAKREHSYYELLVQWMHLLHSGMNINTYFMQKGYKKIGIYGKGKIGELAYEGIDKNQLYVSYITKNGGYIDNHTRIYAINEVDDDNIDIILVTPIYDFDSIKNTLCNYISSEKVVSIKEVIREINNIK